MIGQGRPGLVASFLQKEFFAVVRGENKRYSAWLTPL
jgi:hypothetical protein